MKTSIIAAILSVGTTLAAPLGTSPSATEDAQCSDLIHASQELGSASAYFHSQQQSLAAIRINRAQTDAARKNTIAGLHRVQSISDVLYPYSSPNRAAFDGYISELEKYDGSADDEHLKKIADITDDVVRRVDQEKSELDGSTELKACLAGVNPFEETDEKPVEKPVEKAAEKTTDKIAQHDDDEKFEHDHDLEHSNEHGHEHGHGHLNVHVGEPENENDE